MIKKGKVTFGSHCQREFLQIFCNHFCEKCEINCKWCVLNKIDYWRTSMKEFIKTEGAKFYEKT